MSDGPDQFGSAEQTCKVCEKPVTWVDHLPPLKAGDPPRCFARSHQEQTFAWGWYHREDSPPRFYCPGCVAALVAQGVSIRFETGPMKGDDCFLCGAAFFQGTAGTPDRPVLLAMIESFERTENVMRECARDATVRGHGDNATHCMGLAEGLAIAAIALRGVLADPPASPNGSISSPDLKVVI